MADAVPDFTVVRCAEGDLATELAAAARHGFVLERQMPLRAVLFELGSEEHVLLVLVHHIASDGWSVRPLVGDLRAAFQARVAGREPRWRVLPVQYADFAVWQRELLGSEDDPDSVVAAQIAYWRERLAELPAEIELPADRPRPATASHRGDRVEFTVPAEVHVGVVRLARASGATVFMVMQAALGSLLSRSGAGEDIPIGAPVAGRGDSALEGLVGFFVNTLVLRTDLAGAPTFRELVARVRERDLEAYAHQDLPFERLVEILNPERSAARHPLVQTVLTCHTADDIAALGAASDLPGLTTEPVLVDTGAAKFDLDFEFGETLADEAPAGMTGTLAYSVDRFEQDTARALVDRLLRLLAAAVADPDVAVADLPLLDAAEREQVLLHGQQAGAYVLDGRLRPVPIGVSGDIHELTDEPGDGLLANPFGPHGRWLRPTGERGRWTRNGELLRHDESETDAGSGAARQGSGAGPARATAPRTPHEEILCGLFADFLDVEAVGPHESFFEHGGHSLAAIRLINRVRATFAVDITITDFFENPTPAGTAALLGTGDRPADAAGAVLRAGPRPRRLPLSYAQRRLWLLHRLDGPGAAYNVPMALRLRGRLDRTALRAALRDVVTRHESLRTVFAEDADGPHQTVLGTDAEIPWHVEDVPEHELTERLTRAARRPFDLSCEIPVRAFLFRTAPDAWVVLVVMHHIAGDGWSVGPLAGDFAAAFAARCAGTEADRPPLPVQYADYALWQRAALGNEEDAGSALSRQLDFWRAELVDLPVELDLPVDRSRPAVAAQHGGRVEFTVPADTHAGVVRLARESGATVFMVVQSALAVLLSRLGAGKDIPIGVPVAGRDDAALEGMVGFFVNTLVLRTVVSGDPSFRELVARVRHADLRAFAHQDLPFELLVEALNPERSAARHPLFQVSLTVEPADADSVPPVPNVPGLTAEPVPVGTGSVKFDLSFGLGERPEGGCTGSLQYSAELFDRETAELIVARLVRLLESAVAEPDRTVGCLELLPPTERHQLLTEWNDTADGTENATLPELFESQVRRTPDASALVEGARERSYAELDASANALAHELIARGIGPEDVVALLLPKSADLIVCVLAVGKAGAAWTPVDPALPDARVTTLLANCAAALVLTDPVGAARVRDVPAAAVRDLDLSAWPRHAPTNSDRVRPLRHHNAAYVLHTSGSTGTPKGVVVPHTGLAALAAEERERFAVRPDSRVLQLSAPGFDALVLELTMTFTAGAALVVPEPGPLAGDLLADIVDTHRVTHALVPPAALATVPRHRLASLETLVVGGEACGPELVRRWAPGRRVVNAYGPTESTVMVCASQPLDGEDGVPIGRPVRHTRVYVLDAALRPVPVGVPGELYVCGDGLARGYLRRPALTAERFVALPYGAPGERAYRTGDIVRRRRDGRLDFLGRGDNQVQLRGVRVETGEVEAAVAAAEGVAAAVVTLHTAEDVRRLVAYVVPEPGATLDPAAVRAHAARVLPRQLVPAAVLVLRSLPATVHGKVDRAALPAPDFTPRAEARPATGAHEETLVGLFRDVLGVTGLGVDDGFFDLGGDSILAIDLVARARRSGLVLTPRQVFEHATPARLAAVATDAAAAVGEPPGSGVGPVPLTPIVSWLRDSGAPIARFCQSTLVRTPPGLSAEHTATALAALVDHHDALRLTLADDDGGWELRVREAGSTDIRACLRHVDVRAADDAELRRVLAREGEAARARLDPTRGAVLRAVLFDRGPDREGMLLLVVHHLAVDAVSWRVLLPDLAQACRAALSGRPHDLQPVGTSLRTWARRLAGLAQDSALAVDAPRWARALRPPRVPLADRPLDPAVDLVATARRHTTRLSPETTALLLTDAPAAYRCEPKDILLAALAWAVADWREANGAVVVELERHGRDEDLLPGTSLSRTVGWFTSTHPTRLELPAPDRAQAWSDPGAAARLLSDVREQLRDLPERAAGYGLLRHLNPHTRPLLSGLPAPELAFNYLGRITQSLAAGTEVFAPVDGYDTGGDQDPAAPLAQLLELTALVADGGEGSVLSATWTWASAALSRERIGELADLWAAALEAFARHSGAHGGLTPADVAVAHMSQDEIDEFALELDDLDDIGGSGDFDDRAG
ncbi:non-ribosomal peptide synthetase [Streptomyces malaysiensis]|uniref:non-ribosomal peptide synthetase n=1 Tax=Streptomyces malaysiensis TaxID=92644 RepID=UPI00281591CF|nr:non-ribosomal peptide synthetase [Streptomyces samsunensis]